MSPDETPVPGSTDQELEQRCLEAEEDAAAARAEADAARAQAEGLRRELLAAREAIEGSAHSLEMITSTVRVNAEYAQQADAAAAAAKGAAGEGEAALGQLGQAMERIRGAAEGTLAIIREVNEIAFQTNLLALNAAVEAARAGDAGRGFAVVAEEVRSLALRSKEAATKTAGLIEGSVREAGEGVRSMQQVSSKLTEIAGMVGRVTEVVGEIAASGQDQAAGLARITEAMGQLQRRAPGDEPARPTAQAGVAARGHGRSSGSGAGSGAGVGARAGTGVGRTAGTGAGSLTGRPAGARKLGARALGLSLPTQRMEQWVKAKITMMAQSRRLGVELLVELSECDAALQEAQCRSLLDRGVRALIVAPHDGAAAAAIADHAARAGVPLVAYDRLILNTAQEFHYLAFDGIRIGELQGEYLAQAVPRGRYLLLHGPTTDHNAELFREGAMRKLGPLISSGEVTVVKEARVKDYLAAEAARICAEALAGGARIDAVLAATDSIATGAVEALAAKGLAGKVPVTGLDAELSAAARIARGTQAMTVFKDVRELAKKTMETAAALAEGKPVDTHGTTVSNGRRQVPAVLLAPLLVHRQNIDAVLIDSGYLGRRAVYQGT